ncbi:MAG: Na(+)-translocating NADH-quinone reductase subunit C [Nitrospirales bacterium]
MPEDPTETTGKHRRSRLIGAFLALPNDSPLKTLVVALLLCLVCSMLVSMTAVSLKPLQIANKDLNRKTIILEVSKLLREGQSIDEQFKQIQPKVVNLETGEYIESVDPNEYDQRKAAKDPTQNIKIPADQDIAQIKQRAKYATVYLVQETDQIKYLILPIHGYGLWSTLYGFLVLKDDANTILGIQFYEHQETPGLGGEVDNLAWRKKWEGKVVHNKSGDVQIKLVKGSVNANNPRAQFHVDGLAGATLTSNGVTNMLRYWLGPDGFGPYLEKFRSQT